MTQRRRRRPGDPPPGGGALPRLGPLPPSLPPGRIIPPRRAVTSAGGAAASPPLPQRPDGSEPRLAMQAGKAAGSRDAGRPLQATMKRGYDVLRDPHLNKVRAAGTGAPRRPGWPGAEGGSPFPSPPPGTDKPSAAGRCLRSGSRARRRRRRRGGGPGGLSPPPPPPPPVAAQRLRSCRAAPAVPGPPVGQRYFLRAGRRFLFLRGGGGAGGERRAGPPTPAASGPRRAAAPSPPRLPEKRSSGSRSLGRMLRHGTLLRCEFPLPCLCFPGTPLLFQPSFPRAPQLVSCRQKPGCSCCPTFYPLAGGKGIFITVIALAAVTFNPSFPTALHR